MRASLNTLATRMHLWRRGSLAVLTALEDRTFLQVEPAKMFPRQGHMRLGGVVATQHSHTTCGTTVLALANAMFDPDLLAHLRARSEPRPERNHAIRARFADLQNHLLARATGRSWPQALGTPPWGLAQELKVPGVTYTHLPVDDRNPALVEVLTGVLRDATDAGLPVPLYVGGSTKDRLSAAVPRHVVLLLPPAAMTVAPDNSHARIYEPSSGRVHRMGWADLWGRTRPAAAFGGWTHIAWAVLPR